MPVTLVQWMLRFATLLPLLLFALMSYGVASLFKKQAACDRIRKNALATAKRIEYVSVDVTVLYVNISGRLPSVSTCMFGPVLVLPQYIHSQGGQHDGCD